MDTNVKRWLGLAFAGLIALVAPLGNEALAQDKTVVFAGWGGSIQAAQRRVYFDAFTKETGIRVIEVPDVSLPKIKAMVNSGDVQWDVVQTLGMWVPLGATDNLWTRLDSKIIDSTGVPIELLSEYGIGNSAYGQVLAYNSKATGDAGAPKNWADFWDVSGKPGRRAMQDYPRYTMEFALLADGVAPKDLYPLDVNRAFAKLDKIKSSISVWFKQAPQVPILLASGEVNMSNTTHTRIRDIVASENVPLKVVWNQGLITVDWLAVPRGAKRAENAMKLIAFMTRADLQAKLSKESGIGPTNLKALDLLTEKEREQLPSYYYQKGQMVLFDNAWWAKNNDQMIERWDAWKLK